MKRWAAFVLCVLAVLPGAAQHQSTSDFFNERLPRWFPHPSVPDDNPISETRVELGRYLFYDERLSGNGTYSCGSCHQQALAFTDGLAHAIGSTGESHSRSTMSLTNVAYNATFGWNEQRSTLESQMEVPMYNQHPIEMGLKGRESEILARLTKHPRDLDRFRAAFPGEASPITIANIVKAISSFERILISADSPYDRYVAEGDSSQMSAAALRGSALFASSRLRCGECHSGVNFSGPAVHIGAVSRPDELLYHDTGVAMVAAKFRAPTLRNIAVTGPYMHNGSIATLRDVIHHYARGGRPRPEKSERVNGFAISAGEIDDLVAFLESLTDERFLTNPALSNPYVSR